MISGAAVLLLAIVYGTVRAGRRRQSNVSKQATERMYDDNRNT
jgi:hypothetical protein